MKTKKMNLFEQLKSSFRIFGIALLCVTVITACSDDEDEKIITPVSLSPTSVSLSINAQAEVTISGGEAPYSVSNNSHQTVASGVINGTKLTVTGVTEGITDITVSGKDGSSAKVSVTVTSDEQAPVLTTFEQLKANLSAGESVTLPDAIKIKGAVISDNEGKNIDDKTVVLQEDNNKGGIVLQFTENHNFIVGDEIEVIVSELTLAKVNGELTLIDIPAGNAEKTGNKTITPRETTISDVTVNKEAWAGTLVKLGAGSFTGGDGKYSGTLEYADASGAIKSTILEGAAFANSDYPAEVNSLTGIIRISGTDVRIDIRNTNDVVGIETSSFLLDDFESGVKDIKFKGGSADAVVDVVDNPLKNGLNTSDKVLMVTNSFASQQLNIYIKRAADPEVDITEYIRGKNFDRIRFKYYNENPNRKVMWKYNGAGSQVDITTQPALSEWSYGEIELTNSQMDALTQIHLRLNDTVDGSTENASTDIIYIDDIEFYSSSLTQ